MLPLTPPEPSAAPAPPGDSDKLPVHLGSVMASWQIPVHSGRPRSGQGPSLHWRPHALSVATPDCGPQAPAEAQAPSRAPELPGAPAAWRVEGACSLVVWGTVHVAPSVQDEAQAGRVLGLCR